MRTSWKRRRNSTSNSTWQENMVPPTTKTIGGRRCSTHFKNHGFSAGTTTLEREFFLGTRGSNGSVEVCASVRFRSTKSCWRGSSLGRRRWANVAESMMFFSMENPLNWGNLFWEHFVIFWGGSDQQLRFNLACTTVPS